MSSSTEIYIHTDSGNKAMRVCDDVVMQKLHTLDLYPIMYKFRLAHDSQFNKEEIALIAEEYKRFLYLSAKFPNKVVVPSTAVDDFWHLHILDTRKYASDCEQIFGRFIHHYPYLGMKSDGDKSLLSESFHETRELYNTCFNSGRFIDQAREPVVSTTNYGHAAMCGSCNDISTAASTG